MPEHQQLVAVALAECEPNERLAIDLALDGMASRGWIDQPDDSELRDLIATLRKVYAHHPRCACRRHAPRETSGDATAARRAEYLIGAYERYCQERWMREQAEHWSCPCGETFALCGYDLKRPDFWTLGSDELFAEPVTECPRCARELAKAHEDCGNGQLALGF